MAFNINNFLANINETGGFSQEYAFMVRIQPPAISSQGSSFVRSDDEFYRHLSFRCDNTTFPGRSILSADSRYGTMGVRKTGASATYADIGTTLILSNDFREREFFLNWQDAIVGKHRKERILNADQRERSFNLGYYNDYVSTVDIIQYDISSESEKDWVYRAVLKDCFPMQVNPMSANWASTEVHKIDILWAYHYFTDEWRPREGVTERNTFSTNFFAKLFN